MSFRNFDNSSSPRLVTTLNDRARAQVDLQAGERVVVFGFCKPAKDSNGEYTVPAQELYPTTPGALNIDQLVSATRNWSDDATPVPYPSELSVQLEELRDAGVNNVQVVVLGYDGRYRDMDGKMARERYIALENAYSLLLDLPVDNLLPVNVIPGFNGDTMYSNSDYEVIYDAELFDELYAADPNDTRLSYSGVYGFVQMNGDSEYAKSTSKTLNVPEDLTYLTATVCDMVTANGNYCSAPIRSANPMEVKYLGELDLLESTDATGTLRNLAIVGSDGTAANITVELIEDDTAVGATVDAVLNGTTLELRYDFDGDQTPTLAPVTKTHVKAAIDGFAGIAGVTFVATIPSGEEGDTITVAGDATDSVTLVGGTDGQEGTTFGATAAQATKLAAPTWSMTKTGSGAAANVFGDYDFAGADTAVTGDAVLESIENLGYYVARTTVDAKGIMQNAGGIQTVFKLADKPVVGISGATNADLIAWGLNYGTPSISEVNKWVRFLEAFGNGADSELFENNVASYIELDGVTPTANGEAPLNFRFYRTTDGERPTSANDSAIVKDDNDVNVDMGRYLDVVAANSIFLGGVSKNLIDPGNPRAVNYLAGTGQILGWYNTLPSSVATTRQATGLLTELAYIGTNAVSRLTKQRYQVFSTRDGNYVLNRDITMAIFVSDIIRSEFLNRLTNRIVKDAVDIVYIEGNKLLGKTDTSARREGLRQILEVEFSKWANPEDGRFRDLPTVKVFSSNSDNVIGRMSIALNLAVANEILEIATVINLEK